MVQSDGSQSRFAISVLVVLAIVGLFSWPTMIAGTGSVAQTFVFAYVVWLAAIAGIYAIHRRRRSREVPHEMPASSAESNQTEAN